MITFNKKFKIAAVIALLLLSVFSFSYLGEKFSDPDSYKTTIRILNEKKDNVLALVASSTALSTTLSLLPGDAGTPLAEQLMDISSYLLIVLSILYTEKYLLSVIGMLVFKVLIPGVLVALGINLFLRNSYFSRLIRKISAISLVLILVIPVSTTITHKIDETCQSSKLGVYFELVDNINKDGKKEALDLSQSDGNKPWYVALGDSFSSAFHFVVDKVFNITKTATDYAKATIEKAKVAINNLVEATAVMLVTSCVIPIITLFVFLWLMKTILGLEVSNPDLPKTRRKVKKHLRNTLDNIKPLASEK